MLALTDQELASLPLEVVNELSQFHRAEAVSVLVRLGFRPRLRGTGKKYMIVSFAKEHPRDDR